MAAKKPAPTDDDLFAQLDDLGTQASSRPSKSATTTARTTKQGTTSGQQSQTEQELLAELNNLATQKPPRPETPSLRPSSTTTAGGRSPTRAATATPPVGAKTGEQRQSGDSARSSGGGGINTFTPATTATEESPELEASTSSTAPAAQAGSSWWGGILSTATAAVSQAQAAVKEIQQTEEAKKWAEQVRGNLGGLKGLGGELRSMALPTFHGILQTIAPPISSHERLQIHHTHDLSGYPSLDPMIYGVFSRVMAQVEGGDLMVVQKGMEAGPRHDDSEGGGRRGGGWHDGPWWRSGDIRSVNAIKGSVEGSKLARASAEGYANDWFAARGGLENAARQATETLSETNPTRSSDIFLAVQVVKQQISGDMFAGKTPDDSEDDETDGEEVMFAVYLHDPVHGIAFHTLSQAVPEQWITWLDASAADGEDLPESILEIIEGGGVDPREWVSEWMEEVLSLAVGVVAQKYVAKRMGVGEGAVARGKMRADKATAEINASGGGEAARALVGV